jgi:hypothetical protein
MVNVICKENYGNLGDYCRWAFDEVGVDQIEVYLAAFPDGRMPGHPAKDYFEKFSSSPESREK